MLVSESMAQQTQIATVVPYFERFVAAYPTVEALAGAEEQAVLKLWQGLGYYRRARHLRAAAVMVVERFGGKVPATVAELMELPGVGRYTAGAVASVAHGVAAPVVDGNVARVLARFYLIREAVDRPATLRELWGHAGRLVEASGEPADFNQAMMELGALVCTPKSPSCGDCPLAEGCGARREGVAETLPIKSPKRRPTAVTHRVLAVQRGSEFLFVQRPTRGLWAGMWELVGHEDASDAAEDSAAPSTGRDAAREDQERRARRQEADREADVWVARVAERFGLKVGPPVRVGEFPHQTTHRRIRFLVSRTHVLRGDLREGSGVWRRLDKLDDLPLAKPQWAALRMIDPD